MILLHFRMHWAGEDEFVRSLRNPSWISFQRHAAFWAIIRPVRLYAGTHRAKILCARRGFYRFIFMCMMGMMVVILTAATIALSGRGFGFAAATRTLGEMRGLSLGQKFLQAVVAAKVKRLSRAFSMGRTRFVHGHSANRVFGHQCAISFLIRDWPAAHNLTFTGKLTLPFPRGPS